MFPEQRERHRQHGAAVPPPVQIDSRRLALIEAPVRSSAERPIVDTVTPLRLGTRLRLERERRRITLASIAANTKIAIGLLRGLENNDVSRWPVGIFRRAFIRAYAEAVGLDGDLITREFLEAFPEPDEIRLGAPGSGSPEARRTRGDFALRLTLADSSITSDNRTSLAEIRRRAMAVAVDLTLLTALAAIFSFVTRSFWMPLALATICYHAASIVLVGHTAGAAFFASKRKRERSWR